MKASYAEVATEPQRLASHFYAALFAADPNLRFAFPSDLRMLHGHFEAALALVIRNLDEVSGLRESLRELGGQHVHWRARPEDYLTARSALTTAIRGLSRTWDDTRERYWTEALTAIIVPMIEGAAVQTAMAAETLSAEG